MIIFLQGYLHSWITKYHCIYCFWRILSTSHNFCSCYNLHINITADTIAVLTNLNLNNIQIVTSWIQMLKFIVERRLPNSDSQSKAPIPVSKKSSVIWYHCTTKCNLYSSQASCINEQNLCLLTKNYEHIYPFNNVNFRIFHGPSQY
jgi:hypothetical protein